MALPLAASLAPLARPFERPVSARAVITSPLAIESDSYLGGFASGNRFAYLDMMQFVWWTPGSMPEPPVSDGAGFGNGFGSGFEGGVGSPTGASFAAGFSHGFR